MSFLACLPLALASSTLLITCLIRARSLITDGSAHKCPLNGPSVTSLFLSTGNG
ncbi:hypothetical protein ERO13_A06G169702v2 [Gossypium hirsutum]|nr:hypothetical protein ERO13_A06G169702v2 [Gossypium hirsutum]